MKKQSGFTLMELIIVIIILGILSAFAIPKYMSLDKEARTSTVKALNGSVIAASEMVHGVALAKGFTTANAAADLGAGLIVNITSKSYPTANDANGIGASLTSKSGFTATAAGNEVRYDVTGTTNCSVTYNIAATDNSPNITFVTTGC